MKSSRLFLRLLFASLALPAMMFSEVMVSLSKEHQIAVFDVDPISGKLSEKHRISTPGPPGAMAFNEAGDRLYVAMKSKGGIASFGANADGQFELLNQVAIDGNAGYLAVHPTGEFLLSSYYSEGMVSVHRMLEGGRLADEPVVIVETDERSHAVVSDPRGRFVFVPHTRPNSIFQFRFNEETGALTPGDPPALQREEESGPRHLWFHPTLDFAYSSDEQGKAITSYDLSESGALSVLETKTSFPDDYLEKGSTADIEVHPSGRFVYIANRGVNTIAGFRVNEEDGTVSLMQQSEVEPVPRSFNISPDGNHLVAAGQQSGRLVVFRIDEEGLLHETQRLDSGGSPWWVVFRP
ncbi:MAG: beta-propeller fold lactonase family protein [Verrucomicrobiales bacterium]|nr:beta-propeller fold lactonase family protein [Verrucomicrobiales bacterium]